MRLVSLLDEMHVCVCLCVGVIGVCVRVVIGVVLWVISVGMCAYISVHMCVYVCVCMLGCIWECVCPREHVHNDKKIKSEKSPSFPSSPSSLSPSSPPYSLLLAPSSSHQIAERFDVGFGEVFAFAQRFNPLIQLFVVVGSLWHSQLLFFFFSNRKIGGRVLGYALLLFTRVCSFSFAVLWQVDAVFFFLFFSFFFFWSFGNLKK